MSKDVSKKLVVGVTTTAVTILMSEYLGWVRRLLGMVAGIFALIGLVMFFQMVLILLLVFG